MTPVDLNKRKAPKKEKKDEYVCALPECEETIEKGRKYCSQEHYYEFRKRGGNTKAVDVAGKAEIEKEANPDALNPRQEKFAQLYTYGSKEFYGNGTQSYIAAYKVTIGNEEGQMSYNNARVQAHEVLTNPNVKARINQLLEEGGLNDENVDKQLLFLINQFEDKQVKLRAIKEYNKMKKRVENSNQTNNILAFFQNVHEKANEMEESDVIDVDHD